jgi:hypothetical protein
MCAEEVLQLAWLLLWLEFRDNAGKFLGFYESLLAAGRVQKPMCFADNTSLLQLLSPCVFLHTAHRESVIPLTSSEATAPQQKAQHAKGRPAPTPWRAMLCSPAVWAIVVNNFAFHYAFYVVMNWLPTYFNRWGGGG